MGGLRTFARPIPFIFLLLDFNMSKRNYHLFLAIMCAGCIFLHTNPWLLALGIFATAMNLLCYVLN